MNPSLPTHSPTDEGLIHDLRKHVLLKKRDIKGIDATKAVSQLANDVIRHGRRMIPDMFTEDEHPAQIFKMFENYAKVDLGPDWYLDPPHHTRDPETLAKAYLCIMR